MAGMVPHTSMYQTEKNRVPDVGIAKIALRGKNMGLIFAGDFIPSLLSPKGRYERNKVDASVYRQVPA